MTKTVKCIMLIDDNKIDNFFHERVIKKCNAAIHILAKESGREALEHIMEDKALLPDVIFLDINMPDMNGWEFVEQYKNLCEDLRCAMVVILVGDCENPGDHALAATKDILVDFRQKPLTKEIIFEVLEKYQNSPALKNQLIESIDAQLGIAE